MRDINEILFSEDIDIVNNQNIDTNIDKIEDFLEIIISNNSIEDIELTTIIKNVCKICENGLEYSKISQYIYKTEDLQLLPKNIEYIHQYIMNDSDIYNTKDKQLFFKIKEHIFLCISQYETFKIGDEIFGKKFSNCIEPIINDLGKNIKGIEDKANKNIKEIENNIINQLISLIAIFTTLAFLLFGGMSFLTDLLKQFKDTEEMKILFISCCWGFCFSGVFYMFIYFIFCMIGKEDRIPELLKIFIITMSILGIAGLIVFANL